MTGDQMDEALDRIGAWVETGVHEAHGEVGGGSLVETVDTVLPVFAELLMAPAFAQDKIDLAKTHLRAVIARRNDDPFEISRREILKLVYGATSPYARQYEYEDVDRLTRDDLVAFHAAYYRPDATLLAVWGDFNAAEMKDRLARAFAGWTARGPAPAIVQPEVRPQTPSVNYIEKKDLEQSFLLAGQLGLRLDDPDYPAVSLMSDILGGGSWTSRIFKKVRTEKETGQALQRQLTESTSRLQNLLADLQRRKENALPQAASEFQTRKGQLPWPLRGKIIAAFGSQVHPRYKTKTSNLGIDIKAGPSAAVSAVADGRVAYADQFLGYGNLVIVDHGGGFYTLYANLNEMSAQVGTEVTAGTKVGTASDYVHFEIRKDGKAVNPMDWLKP